MSDITAKKKSNKKLIFIIAGIVLAVVILIIVGISIITSKISGMLPTVEVAHPLQCPGLGASALSGRAASKAFGPSGRAASGAFGPSLGF